MINRVVGVVWVGKTATVGSGPSGSVWYVDTSPDTFAHGEMDAVFGLLHEIGHGIDHKAGWGLSDIMLEAAGAEDSIWDGRPKTNGFCFRGYACGSRIETWADAFALWVINASPYLYNVYGDAAFAGGIVMRDATIISGVRDNDTIDAYRNGNYVNMLNAVSVTLAP